MKILHISDQPPGYISGGQLGILQFSYAWTRIGSEVDYVGPEIENSNIAEWYNKTIYLNRQLTAVEKIRSLVHLQFDRKYMSWKKLSLDFTQYDLIYIDFTKMAYVLKDIRKSGYRGQVIVRAHNVEADFFKINFYSKKTFVNYAKYKVMKPRERYMIKHSDKVLAITEVDKDRLIELYRIPEEKIDICPVGVNLPKSDIKLKTEIDSKLKCLITGSMWFGPNAEATKWFIENVYPSVRSICELTIAGFRPNSSLIQLCRNNSIRIVDSPKSMVPYFESADMVLAPIFEGGGMKVKIAEAMSYGLPVVTTSHGAIGYNLKNNINIYVADEKKEFVNAIQKYFYMSVSERRIFLESELSIYKKFYSLDAIECICKKIIKCRNHNYQQC